MAGSGRPVISAVDLVRRTALPGGLSLCILAACSGGESTSFPPQQWQDVQVVVETRPAPVRPGMNEFLIILTGPGGIPVSDVVVSIRTDENQPWAQTIQDGHTGVFRKAIFVAPNAAALVVNIRRDEQRQTDLYFPLALDDAGQPSGS